MTQLTLDLTPAGTKQDRMIARLLNSDKAHPVSLLDLDRRYYGTDCGRFLRFAVERLGQRGIRVASEWRDGGAGVRFKVWWAEELRQT